MRRTRILHITFNMGIGGTEQVILQLVQGMAPKGIESEILCIDGHIGPVGEALQQSGVPVHKVARKQGFDWSLIATIRKRLRKGRFDVVHCHQYTPWIYGWLGRALRTRAQRWYLLSMAGFIRTGIAIRQCLLIL